MTKFMSMTTDELREEITSLTSWIANAMPIEPQLPKMEAELNSAKAELNRRKNMIKDDTGNIRCRFGIKDYILIAEAIKNAHSHEHERCLDTFKLIGNLGELFYEDNPNFDSGKFFKACEVPKQYIPITKEEV